ncbi:hypothetical protein GCM10027451_33760 [Geodermatophilus aquaeductus]|uniref:Uncharacterized protein n=1 Tax=Geodermatophilus aquaeductus TaxID=1564161 RepID=A0A521EVP7_9ACTN|nr:hypothetical protein [Geodermatophilus aquaeductus]SMO88018.1 hypothetical protein SAMN06273567_10669 [Geodermatophilus aquaeductus]
MTDPGQPGAQPPAGGPQPGQSVPPQGAPYPGATPAGGTPAGATPTGAWQPPAGASPQGGQAGAWGQPQPGQPQPFGQPQHHVQPGPFGPGQPGQPGPFGGPAPAPAGKPGKGRKIGSIVAAVAIAGGVAAFRLVDFGAPDVGDCVQRAGVSDVDIVDCGDSEAELRVVGIEDEKLTEDEYFADPDTCSEFPSATDALWREGKIGSDGTVYCLEPVS